MTNALRTAARYRKGLVALGTGLAWVISRGYLHGQALTDATAVEWALSALGVVAVPNAPADLTEHPTNTGAA